MIKVDTLKRKFRFVFIPQTRFRFLAFVRCEPMTAAYVGTGYVRHPGGKRVVPSVVEMSKQALGTEKLMER